MFLFSLCYCAAQLPRRLLGRLANRQEGAGNSQRVYGGRLAHIYRPYLTRSPPRAKREAQICSRILIVTPSVLPRREASHIRRAITPRLRAPLRRGVAARMEGRKCMRVALRTWRDSPLDYLGGFSAVTDIMSGERARLSSQSSSFACPSPAYYAQLYLHRHSQIDSRAYFRLTGGTATNDRGFRAAVEIGLCFGTQACQCVCDRRSKVSGAAWPARFLQILITTRDTWSLARASPVLRRRRPDLCPTYSSSGDSENGGQGRRKRLVFLFFISGTECL